MSNTGTYQPGDLVRIAFDEGPLSFGVVVAHHYDRVVVAWRDSRESAAALAWGEDAAIDEATLVRPSILAPLEG